MARIPSLRCAVVACLLAALAACGTAGGGAEAGTETAPDVIAESVPDADAVPEEAIEPPALVIGPGTHRVVLQPGASPSEVHAAEELVAALAAVLGAAPPLQRSDDAGFDPESPMILLGQGPLAASLGVNPDPAALGEQGFLIRTAPPHVVIAGTPGVGTLYGVHRFLEDHAGVRWYAPDATVTPPAAQLPVPALDRLQRPAFDWRMIYYAWPGADADFKAHVADNNGTAGPDSPTGQQLTQDDRAHSYFRYVNPDEFWDTHPEYFSEIGGVRVREETQLCLTNPDVLDLVSERMLANMQANPQAYQFNFSQMDRYNYCQCDKCRAMNQQYQTTGGTQFWFVNQLAERVAAVHPDKQVGTLAYMYTEEPPQGLAMHPNVAVWLCHMFPSCDSHPIGTCPLNADYQRRARAWSQLVRHLYVWHYVVDFMHYYNPFPNFRAMAADLRFYRDLGVEGIFMQGMGQQGGGGEWSLMRGWYGARLLFDPDLDGDALIRDFLEGYYGAAAGPLEAYVKLLHDKVTDDDVHMHLYTNPGQGYLPDEIVNESEGLFDQAEALVAGDPEMLERVRVARMPLLYARLFPRNGYSLGGGTLHWQHEPPAPAELKDFLDRMAAHGFELVRETAGDASTMNLVYAIVGHDLDTVTLRNPALEVEVVPKLAGRAVRLTDRASGQDVTAFDHPPVLYFPFAGGLEDRVGGLYDNFGWVEPAMVLEQSETSVTVRLATMNGYELKRTLTLDAAEPVLHVQTVVTNTTGAPQRVRVRNHLELDLGEVPDTRVAFTSRGGQAVDQDLTQAIYGLREGQRFYDLDAPAGEWTFSGAKGLTLTQSFDDAVIESAWVYAFPVTLGQFDAEIWAAPRDLAPGEAVTLEHDIRVTPGPLTGTSPRAAR